MTDEDIRQAFRRMKDVVGQSNNPRNADDYDYMVRLVSDLASEPYGRVFETCLDVD